MSGFCHGVHSLVRTSDLEKSPKWDKNGDKLSHCDHFEGLAKMCIPFGGKLHEDHLEGVAKRPREC